MSKSALDICAENTAQSTARAAQNRRDFPFTAKIMDDLRAPDPKRPELPPFNPRVIWAIEGGRTTGRVRA